MSTNDELCLSTLDTQFGRACYALGNATSSYENAVVVLIRALKKTPDATLHDLASIWSVELAQAIDPNLIRLVYYLHRLLGAEWYVVALHFYVRDINDGTRSKEESRRDRPFYGDDVQEVKDSWERVFKEFDTKQAHEEEAARAWLDRHARQAP